MLTHELKFLTSDATLHLSNEDYQNYKYETKKKADQSHLDSGKRSYCEQRGGHWRSPCPRHLKRLETQLKDRTVVFSEFTNESLITIVFSSGAIAYLTVKLDTLDVSQVLFDTYCVGKLSSQTVTSVAVTRSHMLFIHVDRLATLVVFGKTDSALPCRIADREPHIQTIELGGFSRRTERKLSYYECNNKTNVLIWSATTTEPAPWSPVLEDLANLHLYELNGSKVTLVSQHLLENETLLAELSESPETIHTVEQTICHKSGVSITWSWIRVDRGAAGGADAARLEARLVAPARRAARARRRLLLLCIDGSLHVAHQRAGLTHTTKTGFIVTDVRWSGDLIVATDENGRIQCYDEALSLLHHHTKCLDLTTCFNSSEPKKFQILSTRTINNGIVKLVMFNTGPIALLRISHPRLLMAWLQVGKTANGVSLLRALDWDEHGVECLAAATFIVNRAMSHATHATTHATHGESAAEAAIGAYMAPITPHSHNAKKYRQPVYRLARKFFHHLLRRGRIEKALSLAVDLEAWDLFVDARWAAARHQLQHLVEEASTLAAYYSQFEQRDSECSGSCSRCSSNSGSSSDSDSSTSSEVALPRLPSQTQPTLQLPVTPQPTSTHSIQPNLHQYLVQPDITVDRVKPKWTDNILNTQLTTSSEIQRRPGNVPPTLNANYRYVFQSESKMDVPNAIYRYNINNNLSTINDRIHELDRKPPEKNKVKFSDTVTVAVVAKVQSVVPAVERELADSLPLCPPHKYLAAFEPQHPHSSPGHQQGRDTSPRHQQGRDTSAGLNSSHISAGTKFDYVEV